jgi:hypothetical protein
VGAAEVYEDAGVDGVDGVGVLAVPVLVDVVIFAAAISVAAAILTSALRVAKLAAWYAEAVVIFLIVYVQYLLAATVSTAPLNVSFNLVPE